MSDAWARRLASGERIAEPAVLVVAHADDETLWAGSALGRFDRLTLIHLTDSAPRDMADARRLGFATREAYAVAREAELARALAALGVTPDRLGYGVPDQEAICAIGRIVDRLTQDLRGAALVVTHPYEGGHPDHDAAALAVARACARLGASAPARVEFACYNEHGGARRFGGFCPHRDAPERVRELSPLERGGVARALAAHRSQAGVIDGWVPEFERWRAAPAYDFTRPPEPALYDGFGWAMTSTRWRALAAAERAPA